VTGRDVGGQNFGLTRPRLALAVVLLGALLSPLDTAVNTAFPVITAAFGLALRDIQWVVIPFVLAQSCLALVFGHLGDRIGHRRIFAIGVAAAAIGHAAVALAPDYPTLVAMRVVQGAAVGVAVSCAPALATLMFPAANKARVLAIFVGVNSLAMAIAPALGGLLLAAFGWPGVYWFRVPVALLALALVPLLPRGTVAPPPGVARPPFDWIGAIGLTLVLATTVLGLTELGRAAGASVRGMALLLTGLAGGAFWVRHETRCAHPVLRMAPFRSPRFAAIQFASVAVNLACFANLLLLPYVLSRAPGASIVMAGLLLACYPFGSVLGSVIAGRLGRRLSAARAMTAGLIGAAGGLALTALILALWPSPLPIALGMLASGLGLGLFQVGYMDQTTTLLPVHERGVAGSLVSVTRLLGILLGATGISWLHGLSGDHATSFGVLAAGLGVFALGFTLVVRRAPDRETV
jgi:MFS family permease